MSNPGNVNVNITANTQTLAAELARGFGQINTQLQQLQQQFGNLSQATQNASNQIVNNTQNMNSGLNNLNGGINGLRAGVSGLPDLFMTLGKALASVFAAGAVKDFVEEYVKGTLEVGKLAEKFNIAVDQADELGDALALSGKSVDDYMSAYKKLNEQLTNNSKGLVELGFSTEIVNSKTKDRTKILEEGYRVMMQYAEGPERDAAAMKIFGESADEAAKMFEGLAKNKEEAARISQAFGQANKEEIVTVKEYSETMARLSLILEKFGEYIGSKVFPAVKLFSDALLDSSGSAIPTFIDGIDKVFDVIEMLGGAIFDFASFMTEIFAPSIDQSTDEAMVSWDEFMGGLAAVLGGAKVILLGVVGAFEIAWGAVKVIVRAAATGVAGQIEFIKRVMDFDFSGAISEFKRWKDNVINDVTTTAAEVGKKLAAIQAAQVRARNGQDLAAPKEDKPAPSFVPPPRGGNRQFNRAGSGAGAEADAAAKAQLALAKATSEARLQIAMAELALEESELKRSLDRREITVTQYLSREQALKEKAMALQIAAKESEIDQNRIAESRAKKEAERIALKANEAKLQADLTKLELQRSEIAKVYAEQNRRAGEESARQLGDMRSQVAALSGLGGLNAQLDSIARKFRELPKDIANSAEASQLKSLQVVQAQIEETKRQFSNMQGSDDLKAVGAKDLYNRGLLTEANYKRQIAEITRQNADLEIGALNQQIALLDRLGVGYDAQKAKLFEQRDALSRLKEGIDETAMQANESLRSSIEQAFIDVTNGKGIKGFGNAIMNQVNGVFAKKFSNNLMGMLNDSGVGGSGGLIGKLLGTGGKDNNNDAMAQAAQAATTSLQSMATEGVEKATGSLIGQVAQQGMMQNVSSMVTNSLQSVAQAASAAASALSQVGGGAGGGAAAMGGGGGGIGGFISSIFGSFGGFRANGGFAMGGTPYVVGENGPELFIPSSSGSVVSNSEAGSMSGGGGGNVYMNISTPNADSFRKASQQTIVDYSRAMSRVNRRNG